MFWVRLAMLDSGYGLDLIKKDISVCSAPPPHSGAALLQNLGGRLGFVHPLIWSCALSVGSFSSPLIPDALNKAEAVPSMSARRLPLTSR